jgi:hypothetical protein
MHNTHVYPGNPNAQHDNPAEQMFRALAFSAGDDAHNNSCDQKDYIEITEKTGN